MHGEFVAPELVREQTIPNLQLFSNRLAKAHEMLEKAGKCNCGEAGMYPVKTEKGLTCILCGEEENDCTHECESCNEYYCVNSEGQCPVCD